MFGTTCKIIWDKLFLIWNTFVIHTMSLKDRLKIDYIYKLYGESETGQ